MWKFTTSPVMLKLPVKAAASMNRFTNPTKT